MASLGLLISRSLYLSQSLITLVVWFGVGAPMLLAVNKIVGVLIFPALSIEDEIYTAVRQCFADSAAPLFVQTHAMALTL